MNSESTEVQEEYYSYVCVMNRKTPEISKQEEKIEEIIESPSQEEEKEEKEEEQKDIKEEEEKEEEKEVKEAEEVEESKPEELVETKDENEVNRNGHVRGQERQRERNLDPMIVPRNPRYFNHDIRGVEAY